MSPLKKLLHEQQYMSICRLWASFDALICIRYEFIEVLTHAAATGEEADGQGFFNALAGSALAGNNPSGLTQRANTDVSYCRSGNSASDGRGGEQQICQFGSN